MNEHSADAEQRPSDFNMQIQGGMLEALGINMYTTLGRCLVEFVANAYDSDATKVDISIPIDKIDEARKSVRASAKREVAAGKRDRFTVLLEALPTDISVIIEDDGHGMSWREIGEKYLPLNRKRRADSDGNETLRKSESGRRFVMGRKGLGKLAGFGAAEIVAVTSKRSGESFSTNIEMRDEILKVSKNIADVPIPATYKDDLPEGDHGTTITLSGLKSDAVKESIGTLKNTIAEAFYGIRPEEFAIHVNGELIDATSNEFVVVYPSGREPDGFANHTFSIEDVGEISIKYFVGFRAKSLPARKRGARIYCNNRLAAGPSLFHLPTGMHSFHSSDYMECVVEADELDRSNVDFVTTNRSQLREDTEVVRQLLTEISELMKMAIPVHAKYRETKAEEDLESDKVGRLLTAIVAGLPKKTRRNARRLLTTLAAEFGVESEDFQDLAPVILNSLNATEVLVNLVHLRTNPETISKVAEHLRELGEIERDDALKLFRARRNGIAALQSLWEKGEDEWGKKGIEAELHELLKNNPWLIRPELSNYLTSDEDLNKVVTKVARHLSVDKFSKIMDGNKDDETRPDLVFVMSDPILQGPFVLNVVELKSPTIPLTIDHYRQLQDYLFKINEWTDNNLSHVVSIRGFLIGTMPRANASAAKQKQLLDIFKNQGAQPEIRIIGLNELVNDARAVHIEAIRALEARETEEEYEE